MSVRLGGFCMSWDCSHRADWYAINKKQKVSARYCDHHYYNWAIPQNISKNHRWARKETIIKENQTKKTKAIA